MINLTALIRCKPGKVDTVLDALMASADYVRAHEPGTVGYRIIRSDDPSLLLVQENFTDRSAIKTHNDGKGAKNFYATVGDLLDDVTIYTGDEVLTFARSD